MSSFDPLGISAPPADSSEPERDINGNPMPPKTSAPAPAASLPLEATAMRDARPSWERAAPSPSAAASRPAGAVAPPPGSNGFRAVPAPQPAAGPLPPPAPRPAATSFAPSGEAVKYDLAGNPLPSTGPAGLPGQGGNAPAAPYPPASGVRYDLSGNPLPAALAPAAGAWPPPPTGGFAATQTQNSSGKQEDVPPEIARLHWNWGAFLVPRLWCYRHGMTTVASILWGSLFVLRWLLRLGSDYAGLISITYLVLDYGVAFYLGFNGHRLAWRNRRFLDMDEFFKVQRAWMIGGLLWQLAIVAFYAWMFFIIFSVLSGVVNSSHHHHYYAPSNSGNSQPMNSPGGSGDVPSSDAPAPGSGNSTP